MNLSVCLIVKDEASNLPALLACLPLSEIEFIVVDTGSQDSSVEIALAAGALLEHFSWKDDFSEARNVSIAKATRDWILWLDADDRLEPGFWRELESLLNQGPVAHRCVVRSPREDGSCETFLQTRLFPNHLGIQFEGRIHEQLGSSLNRKRIPIRDGSAVITHMGYAAEDQRKKKSRRNAELLRREFESHSRDAAVVLQYGNALAQLGELDRSREVFWSFIGFQNAHSDAMPPPDERAQMFPALIAETFEKSGDLRQAYAWHKLSRKWAPDYLRSGYVLAKGQLEQGNAPEAVLHLLSTLERPPRIGLVACDNAGVRKNALALLISISMSPGALRISMVLGCDPKRFDQIVQDGIHELANGDRFPISIPPLLSYLMTRQWWTSLIALLGKWAPRGAEELGILEDAIEAMVIFAPLDIQQAAGNYLRGQPDFLIQSGVLCAFEAMLQEKLATNSEIGRKNGWAAFQKAIRHHPEDPTVLGQAALFADRHRLQSELLVFLNQWNHQGKWVREIISHLENALDQSFHKPANGRDAWSAFEKPISTRPVS